MGRKKKLLNKFLKGTARDDEARKVESWLDRVPQNNNPWGDLGENEKAAFLRDLSREINAAKGAGKGQSGSHHRWIWIAASVIILLTLPFYMLWKTPPTQIATNVAVQKVVESGVGEIKELRLGDGSRVWLNAGSRIRYPDSFDIRSRDVFLEGQAYFEISRDTKRPFVVHAASWQVTVLGTHFDVSDYRENNTASVSVRSGKVSVQSIEKERPPAVLDAGRQLDYDKKAHTLTRRSFTDTGRPEWTNKEVMFYHTKMADVAGYIRRNYGVVVRIADPRLEEMEVSGNFGRIDKVEDLVELICLTINAQYKTNGENILITQMQ